MIDSKKLLSVLPVLVALATGCSSASGTADGSYDDENGSGTDGGFPGGTSGASSASGFTTDDGDSAASDGGDDPSGGTGGGAPDTGDDGQEPDDSGQEPDEGSTGEGTSTGEPVCDDQTPVELFLSPDDSNSMSSPVQVRNAVLSGWSSLSSAPIRPWEFLNYYSFDYPAAPEGELALHTSLLQAEGDAEGEFKLQIAVASPSMMAADRAKMNITLVLDESGSMSGSPMELQQETCRVIAGSLRTGDIVSMVGWDTANATILAAHDVTGPNDSVVLDACNGLEAGGGTDLHGGLVAGYELADQSFDESRINRIVLMSDGGANAGITDEEIIAQYAGSNDQDGIYMVGVGVGDESYNDQLMDHVTDIGKGASVYIDSEAEAQKIFGDRFLSTMAVSARDVQVRLDMPPGFEIVKFSGEEFSADPTEIEPQHLAPNDAMVFHQTIATCAPELAAEDAEITVTARFKDAVTFEQREITQTITFADLLSEPDPMLLKGAAIFEYAEALKALRDEGDEAAIAAALETLAAAETALPEDGDLAEIRQVLEAL
ncbi:MAG: VWA domain-containing protein [Myxococcota bacterium]